MTKAEHLLFVYMQYTGTEEQLYRQVIRSGEVGSL